MLSRKVVMRVFLEEEISNSGMNQRISVEVDYDKNSIVAKRLAEDAKIWLPFASFSEAKNVLHQEDMK